LVKCRTFGALTAPAAFPDFLARQKKTFGKKRLKVSGAEQLAAERERFSKDVHDGLIRIVPISAATFAHARRIARTQTRLLGTRSLDVLHVASALALRASSFCTFDKNQARLAGALGLRVP
jgi:predicted nucleic acid-binding protein